MSLRAHKERIADAVEQMSAADSVPPFENEGIEILRQIRLGIAILIAEVQGLRDERQIDGAKNR